MGYYKYERSISSQMYTEEYRSGTFIQTEAERARDRSRMLALQRALEHHDLGTCYPNEASEWNNVWRIPFDKKGTDLRHEDFQRLRALGVTLSVKESFEGCEYLLELPKSRSVWRGWSRCHLVTYGVSILGIVVTGIGFLLHVRRLT